MITIIFNNSAGELDRRVVEYRSEAAMAAIQMISEAGDLNPGDTIVIEGEDEGERVPTKEERDAY